VLAWFTTGTGAHVAFLAPVLILGGPAALPQLFMRRGMAPAIRVLLAWAGAAIPAILLCYPWL
jgi:hypothetical protein